MVLQKLDTFNQKWSALGQKLEIKNQKLKTLFRILLFLISLHWFYTYVGVYSYIHVRPSSIHSSAQCQRASIALNYYETDMNFFKPRVQKYTKEGGVTGVEFPIMYYLDALVYKAFGFNEANARYISLILVSCGFFFFFLLSNHFLKNSFLSIAVVGSAAFSPVLLFYSPNFMPDAPSIALVLIAWYYFFKYITSRSRLHLNLFIVLATLAALIKVVALIALVVVICLLVLDRLKYFKTGDKERLFVSPLWLCVKIGISFFIVLAWYFYANWLAKAYNNETFSLSPVMGDSGTLKAVLENINALWLFHYYANESYVLFVSSGILLIVFVKFANRILATITLLYFIGNLVFIYFFLNQFINHDYYIISILPLIFFLLLTFLDVVVRLANTYFRPAKFIFFIIIFFNMKESVLNCKENYHYRYSNEIYWWTLDHRQYYDLEKRLRQVGIKRTDLTISGFDDTFCSSLYLMNQIGIPFSNGESRERIHEMISYPESKYLVLNDSAKFNKIYPNNFAKQIVLTHRGLIVYKLK